MALKVTLEISFDNTYACFSKTIQESKCEVALNWFNENKIIVNPVKFEAIIIDKRK